jgi:hypothetical protein
MMMMMFVGLCFPAFFSLDLSTVGGRAARGWMEWMDASGGEHDE